MLIDEGPETVTVYVEEPAAADSRGNIVRKPGSTPTVVGSCFVTPVQNTEDLSQGQAVGTEYDIYCRTFPGGPYSRVAWNGREWDVIGQPAIWTGSSAAMSSTVVRIRARTG